MTSQPILLEVCVDSVSGVMAAVEGGAQRIELCSALTVDGLTPSRGLMAAAADQPIEVFALIRPREGGFVYAPAEAEVIEADIEAARKAELDGVVVGAMTADRALDLPLLQRLKAAAGDMPVSMHRVFDMVADPFLALEQAVDLGFCRILSSGQATSAAKGAPLLRDLITRADDRITVMPGSGIAPGTVGELIEATGAHEVHASCRVEITDRPDFDPFGFERPGRKATDTASVRAMMTALEDIRGVVAA